VEIGLVTQRSGRLDCGINIDPVSLYLLTSAAVRVNRRHFRGMLELEREESPTIEGENDRDPVRTRLPRPATHGTVRTVAQRAGRVMADRKPATRGRRPPDGPKKQFLTNVDPHVIRRIKAVAALHDKTASLLLEEIAREWLDRHQDGKK
jgi:hypothetical protein